MTFPSPPPIAGDVGTDGYNINIFFEELAAWAGGSVVPGFYVFVDTRSTAQSYTLPDPDLLPLVVVKDKYGHAQTNNITVHGSGVSLIDGNPTFRVLQNYGANTFIWNGDSWSVVA